MQNTEEITATWCDFKDQDAPYLRKHQYFTARFQHRNTISAMYLKVSATGSWECKLEGKVTWALVMGSLFHTVSEHGPTSDSFVREEGDAWGQRRSHFKRSTSRERRAEALKITSLQFPHEKVGTGDHGGGKVRPYLVKTSLDLSLSTLPIARTHTGRWQGSRRWAEECAAPGAKAAALKT